MNVAKRLYLGLYDELRIRRNLYFIRDRRFSATFLSRSLRDGARFWPEVLPCKPRSILDIGAHRGEVAEQLATLYHPEFMGLVEPLPQMAALLAAQQYAPRQKLFQCALGRIPGKATLNVLSNLPSSSLLKVSDGCDLLFQVPLDKTDAVEVDLRTLDSIFAECSLKNLDLLKIDVQGYELEVFNGGLNTLRMTRCLVTEVSFFEHYQGQPLFHEIYAFLRDLGFEMRGTFGYRVDKQGLPLQCDTLFLNRRMFSAIQS